MLENLIYSVISPEGCYDSGKMAREGLVELKEIDSR
jgi:acetyl-CoA carboxylase alpha subunit